MRNPLYPGFLILLTALTMVLMQAGEAYGIICTKTSERRSGLNKICYYNCAGSEAAITVKSHELCPLTIER